jgi:hypothetical protein
MANDAEKPSEFGKKLGEAVSFGVDEFITASSEMKKAANELVGSFSLSRARVGEMMSAVSEAAPRMKRLGADFEGTLSVMGEIATATGKNTLASADSVAKLYATTKVIGGDVKGIVNSFTDAGIQFGVVGEQLEESVVMVRDLGLNAKEVMGQVVDNTSKLNRFNFDGGVQGLTKMAARASQLRFDMSEAFSLAEDAMNPERAVELASSFQRLGVSVGTLADPFALMNASINDPGALQESLVNATKQFTYFDEKTKSFKINPQGMLTLRQMAKETGMSYENLSKSGLAAAELDKRLSQISPSLNFKDESDKQFLTNLSEMDASGNYVVKIRDDQGIDSTKKLSEVTQTEFDKLIKAQKEQPQSMEDIARASMKTGDVVANDVSAIKQAVVRGAVSTSFVKDNMEAFRKIVTTPTGSISKEVARTEIFSDQFNSTANTIRDAVKELTKTGGKSMGDIMKDLGDKFGAQSKSIGRVVEGLSQKIYSDIKGKNLSYGDSELGDFANNALRGLESYIDKTSVGKAVAAEKSGTTAKASPSKSLFLDGTESLTKNANQNQTLTSTINNTVDYTGTVTFKVDAPPGVSTQYLEQFVNTEKFKEMIYKYVDEKNKQLQKTK